MAPTPGPIGGWQIIEKDDFTPKDWELVEKDKSGIVFKGARKKQGAVSQLRVLFVDTTKNYLSRGDEPTEDGFKATAQMSQLLEEFFWAAILWTKLKINAPKFLNSMESLKKKKIQVLAAIILNSMYNRAAMLKCDSSFVKLCVKMKTFIPWPLFREHLDPFKLTSRVEDQETASTSQSFRKQFIRARTNQKFAQKKFNLLVEETEGWSNLTNVLLEHVNIKPYPNFASLSQKINAIVGYFNLCPNRVCYLILDALEHNPEDKVLNEFLLQHSTKTISQMLGFKFQARTGKSGEEKEIKSLCVLAATLIRKKVVRLHDLIPHMTPSIEELVETRENFETYLRGEAKKTLTHNLNMTQEEREKQERADEREMRQATAANKKLQERGCPLLDLLQAMMELGDTENTDYFFKLLRKAAPELRPSIRAVTRKQIEQLCLPIYWQHCSQLLVFARKPEGLEPVTDKDLEDFIPKMLPALQRCTGWLHDDPELTTMVFRVHRVVIRHLFQTELGDIGHVGDTLKCLFQIYSFIPSPNVSLGAELHETMRKLPYNMRYRLYGWWRNECYDTYPELMVIRARTIKATKHFLRRYCVDETNPKKPARQLASVVAGQPCIVLDIVTNQLQSYSGSIELIVDSFRFLTPLGRDVLIWDLLRQMEKKRPNSRKILPDGNYAPWFRALSEITGLFFKKYADTEMSAPLQYVVSKLRTGCSDHLLVLELLLKHLSGIEAFGDKVTEENIHAMAGGPLLQSLRLFGEENAFMEKNHSPRMRSVRSFMRTIISQELCIELQILMAQSREGLCVNDTKAGHVVLSELIDLAQDCLVQLHTFQTIHAWDPLATNIRIFERYLRTMPCAPVLMRDFHIREEVAYMLTRPLSHQKPQLERLQVFVNKTTLPPQVDRLKDLSTDFRPIGPPDEVVEAIRSMDADSSGEPVLLGEELRAWFWYLGLADVCDAAPALYDKETKHLLTQIDDVKFSDSREATRLEERCKGRIEKLGEERKWLTKRQRESFGAFEERCQEWFHPRQGDEAVKLVEQFFSNCLLPRVLLSDWDALYCGYFVERLVNSGAKNFRFLTLFEQVHTRLMPLLGSSTFSESRRLGRFLSRLFLILERLRKNKKVFEAKFSQVSEFASTDGLEPLPPVSLEKIKQETETGFMSHKVFCTYFRRWHQQTTVTLINAIGCSKEHNDYVLQKNAILLLHQLSNSDVFPLVSSHARWLDKNVSMVKKEKGSAMDLLCQRVCGIIKRAEKDGKHETEATFGGYSLKMPRMKNPRKPQAKAKKPVAVHVQDKILKEKLSKAKETQRKRKSLEPSRKRARTEKPAAPKGKWKPQSPDDEEEEEVRVKVEVKKKTSRSGSSSKPARRAKRRREESQSPAPTREKRKKKAKRSKRERTSEPPDSDSPSVSRRSSSRSHSAGRKKRRSASTSAAADRKKRKKRAKDKKKRRRKGSGD